MERILQALERARGDDALRSRDRVPAGDQHSASPRLVTAASEAPARPRPLPRAPVAPSPAPQSGAAPRPGEDGIVYSRTRTVAVDRALFLEKRVFVAYPGEPAGEAYRILSTQVLQRLRANRWNALAVVSPGIREGKTLTAVNLAIGLSMEVGHTVLLVDADLRHPGVHEYFGLPPGPGLSEHLVHDVPLEGVLVNPGLAGLVVLPGGAPLSSSSELLGSPRMRELVQELKRRYPDRIVLFDLPPVLSAADALAFSPYVDATIMVVEEGRTGEEDVLRAADLLESVNLIGTVLNNSRASTLRVDEREMRARTRRGVGADRDTPAAGPRARSRGLRALLGRLLGRRGESHV
jgi:capsular exopolysaccharide synthesis family protein